MTCPAAHAAAAAILFRPMQKVPTVYDVANFSAVTVYFIYIENKMESENHEHSHHSNSKLLDSSTQELYYGHGEITKSVGVVLRRSLYHVKPLNSPKGKMFI